MVFILFHFYGEQYGFLFPSHYYNEIFIILIVTYTFVKINGMPQKEQNKWDASKRTVVVHLLNRWRFGKYA